MRNKHERVNGPVYIKRYNGWYWVQWEGQHSYYHGPYKTREEAEQWKTNKEKKE